MPRHTSRLRRLLLACTVALAATAGSAGPARAIVGGTPTAAGAAPWMVALIDSQTGKKTIAAGQFCGSSLIAPNLLLTAAHCVSDDSGYTTSASDIKAFDGLTLPLRKGTLLGVKSVRVYKKYQDGAGETNGDVATLELEKPIRDRTPIRVGTPAEVGGFGAGLPLHLWGWGNRAGGQYENYPRQLQDGEVVRYSDAQCDSFYGRYFNPAGQLCAGQPDGHIDACQGDSGGPLTGTLANGTPVLVATVSYGEGCGVPQFPTVYTKPSRYVKFVRKSMKDAAEDLAHPSSSKRHHQGGKHDKRHPRAARADKRAGDHVRAHQPDAG